MSARVAHWTKGSADQIFIISPDGMQQKEHKIN